MSEESSSKLDIHVPHYVSQIHMIYGDAEKDGLLSKCLKFDIRSSFSTFRIITESQIKVLHVWYKPPIAARVKCTKILFYLNGRLSNVLNPGPQSNLYYDTLDGVGLGANVALEEPDFAEDGFSFEKSEDRHGSCDIFNIEKCKFCAWSGSWFGKDNHYMEFHANKEVIKEPFDNFDFYFSY